MTGVWLDETRARLGRAVERLDEKRREARSTFELKRLEGKIEGVKLALSYLDEESRTAPEGVFLIPDDREQMEALIKVYFNTHGSSVDALAAAVRSLLPPPPKVKPEEPTEWDSAVRTGDTDEEVWITRCSSPAIQGNWLWGNRAGTMRRWSEMPDDVEIVRVGTGVES